MRSGFLLLILCTAVAVAQQPDARMYFNRAIQDQQRGNYTAAIRDYQEALKLEPAALAARANLAVALAHEKRYSEAITQYRLVLAAAPHDPGLLMDLGLAYYKKGDYRDAAQQFRAVAAQHIPNARLATLLADCDVKLGQSETAARLLLPMEPANASNPSFEYVLGVAMIHSGHQLDGVARLEKVGAATKNAAAYMEAGSTLIDLNRFARAQKDLEAAVHLNPNLPDIYSSLGIAVDLNGHASAAEPLLRKALQLNPRNFNANLYLGSILYKKRDLPEAKVYLDRAMAIQPSSPTAIYELALWQSTSGDYKAAAANLQRLEKSNPSWMQPHVELAVVYYHLNRPADGMRERQIVAKLAAKQQQAGPPGIPTPR
jgi:tetratricopeptide (TPR) repeat protein